MSIRGDNTRKRILQAAKQVFTQKGFSTVTMKDICLAAGISRSGLYEHYSSTAEIFQALFSSLSDPQTDFIEEQISKGASGVFILDTLFSIFDQELRASSDSLSLAIYEYAETCDRQFLQQMHESSMKRWELLLDYGISRGEFAPIDRQAFIELLLYSYQGVMICGRFLPDTQTPSRILPYLREMLIPKK